MATGRGDGAARIVVVSRDAADTLADCLDGVSALDLEGTDVVVVDLDSSDASADVAIHHPLPDRVRVVRPGDLDRVLEVASVDLGVRRLVLLPGDRRPEPGWLEAAMESLDGGAWVVFGPDEDLCHLAIDRVRLQHVSLLGGARDAGDVAQRVRAAGGEVAVAAGMCTDPAHRREPLAAAPRLPAAPRPPPSRPRAPGMLSVVLCTKDRPDQLARCLRSLAALDDPCHEVVVVDNHARPTVTLDGLCPRARVVHEPRPGLDAARNRGMVEARGSVVAFIDDDCEADAGWLDGLRVAFGDPAVAAVTGRVRPATLRQPAQRWFESQFSFDRGSTPRRFTPWDRRAWYPLWTGGIGTGCNMAFRRDLLVELGGFDEHLDMGTWIGGGGDLDVFARLLDRSTVIQYEPAALVWHHHRATVRSTRRQFWGYGLSVGALLTKAVIERPGLRVAAVRFFLDRLHVAVRTLRQARAGSQLLPAHLVVVDIAGQLAGVVVYLAARRRAAATRT